MLFTLGQRWISDAENELGLGTVIAVDARTVTLLFPTSGENRLYARDNAPITRVLFSVNDTITSQEGWQLRVVQVQENGEGLISYQGINLDNNESVSLREVMLDSRMTFSKPQDRLFAGQIERVDRYTLRYQARLHQSQQYTMPWSGLRGMRASLIPHQVYIAHEISRRYAPRVLLADEVGLGKTIEAGMIIHQQLLSGRAERVLIVLPESLQYQWIVEMIRRFNLYFSLFDDERYHAARQECQADDNPFESAQLVLCSLDFVCEQPERLDQLVAASWDLLVVDEAHHLQWSEQAPSQPYQAVARLAEQATGVLLLTATPEQLGQQGHFARLRLLDPDRFHNYHDFLQEQQHYHPVADAVSLLLANGQLSTEQHKLLANLMKEQDVDTLLHAANSEQDTKRNSARQQLVQMLMDRHGTSRILFRNTRQSVKGFPQRRLQPIGLPLPAQYQQLFIELSATGESSEQQAIAQLYPECFYRQQQGQHQQIASADWYTFDPRVEWLLNHLLSQRQQKCVVICSSAMSAIQLEQVLHSREAIAAALFHEGLSLIERDRAAAWFATQDQGAQVLLCSEIGSEGRNFQFAHQLIMFDLPLNPDLLEQRIGRLDRIGQEQDIQIIVPYLQGSAQALLLRWYDQALNAFETTCPTSRAVYDHYAARLLHYLACPGEPEEFEHFIQQCHDWHQQLKRELEQGRDRLLEIHSSGGSTAQALVEEISKQDNDIALVNFAFSLFDIVGIQQEDHSNNLLIISPSDQMLVPDFPGIPADGCTITFDREQALAHEDAQFITWEHPIIRHGLDLVVSDTIGCCAVSLLKNRQLPVGTLLLELIYLVEVQAPKRLQLTRFLPPTPVRLLLDSQGNNLATKVEFEQLERQLNSINRHNANKLVQALRREVTALLQQAEPQIEQQARQLISNAIKQAETEFNHELTRLTALQSVNPTIRDDELTALKQHRQAAVNALSGAGWRLDAIRLIVVAHQ